VVRRPEIPNNLKERSINSAWTKQVKDDTANVWGQQGKAGGWTGQCANPVIVSFFSVQPRSSKVCTERKTTMYFPHANTYLFLCPNT